MNKPGNNLQLFKKSYENDNYWHSNLGSKDYQIVNYLFNRVYEELQILEQFDLCQRIIEFTRTKQTKVAKINSHVYEEIRRQFESHQNELITIDYQLYAKLKQRNEELLSVFGD